MNYSNSRKTLLPQENMLPSAVREEEHKALSRLWWPGHVTECSVESPRLEVRPLPRGSQCFFPSQGHSPFFAGVTDSVAKSEVPPGDDGVFDGRRLSADNEMAGRWRSVPAAGGRALEDRRAL